MRFLCESPCWIVKPGKKARESIAKGGCTYPASTCKGEVKKCPFCMFPFCEYHFPTHLRHRPSVYDPIRDTVGDAIK